MTPFRPSGRRGCRPRRHHRAVEGARHREALGADPRALQPADGLVNRGRGPGDIDQLLGVVVVGHHHVHAHQHLVQPRPGAATATMPPGSPSGTAATMARPRPRSGRAGRARRRRPRRTGPPVRRSCDRPPCRAHAEALRAGGGQAGQAQRGGPPGCRSPPGAGRRGWRRRRRPEAAWPPPAVPQPQQRPGPRRRPRTGRWPWPGVLAALPREQERHRGASPSGPAARRAGTPRALASARAWSNLARRSSTSSATITSRTGFPARGRGGGPRCPAAARGGRGRDRPSGWPGRPAPGHGVLVALEGEELGGPRLHRPVGQVAGWDATRRPWKLVPPNPKALTPCDPALGGPGRGLVQEHERAGARIPGLVGPRDVQRGEPRRRPWPP